MRETIVATAVREPILTGLLFAALPPLSLLPSRRYRVRAIVDYGADHYIGRSGSWTSSGGPSPVASVPHDGRSTGIELGLGCKSMAGETLLAILITDRRVRHYSSGARHSPS